MQKPNYTQVPNELIDSYMSKLNPAAVLVYIAICRKTIGWHKDVDRIGYSQFQKMTGLSINGIKKAINELIENDLINQYKTKKGYEYDLKFSDGGYHSVTDVVSLSDRVNAKSVSLSDTTKESNINKLPKKNISDSNESPNIFPDTEKQNKDNIDNQVEEIYKLYPAKCEKSKRSLGKGLKDKILIKKILSGKSEYKDADKLKKAIVFYLQDSYKSGTYLKNFKTFLNNLPDWENVKEAEFETDQRGNYKLRSAMESEFADYDRRYEDEFKRA